MKVIFTDIDGVLNPKWNKRWYKKCVIQYNRIIEETCAKCVVSSSWRVNKQEIRLLQNLFIDQGVFVDVIGFTPVLNLERGFEIKTWLDEYKVDKFIILDDKMDDIKPYFISGLIQPICYIGLTKELADKAIEYLNT